MGLDTIKLERWRSHGNIHKLGNVHKNERETNKVDRIRKEAHFFLLEYNYKENTSPVSVLVKIL